MSTKTAPTISEQEISDAYIYLLGRLTITRQQQLDFNEGFKWNELEEVLYYKGAADSTGALLHSDNAYSLTFPNDDLPDKYARYFWSVIAVDAKHMRVMPNPLDRFLINKQSKLQHDKDGSLTLYFAPLKPENAPDGNWLPTLGSQNYRLTFRFYGPRGGVADGTYFPHALQRLS